MYSVMLAAPMWYFCCLPCNVCHVMIAAPVWCLCCLSCAAPMWCLCCLSCNVCRVMFAAPIWWLSVTCLAGLYAGSNYCQSHVLVDTWMLTVKLVYKLSNCAWWPEMGYKHTFDTIYTHLTNHRPFLLLHFCTCPQPVLHISTRPYSFLPDQVMGGRVSR